MFICLGWGSVFPKQGQECSGSKLLLCICLGWGSVSRKRDRSGSKLLVCIYVQVGGVFSRNRDRSAVGVNSFYVYVQVGGVFARNRDRSGSKLLVVTVRKHYKDSTKSLVRTVISGVCKNRQISIEIIVFFNLNFSSFLLTIDENPLSDLLFIFAQKLFYTIC